jgi:hypothetical protein
MYNRMKKLEAERGNLEEIIPRLVNERGQEGAARELGFSKSTINLWLKQNGYEMRIVYVKREEQAS